MILKKLNRPAAILLCAVMLGVVIAGCGSSSQSTVETSDNAAETAEKSETGAEVNDADETAKDSGAEQDAEGNNEETAENTEGEDVIVLAESWSFDHYYPVVSPETGANFGSAYWCRNFYDTLVEYDSSGQITGALAKDWEISDDGLTYTFYLKEDICFSDGTPVTADAVKQSIDAANVNLGGYLGNYGKIGVLITSTEAVNEYTFVITLSNPYYSALNDLTYCVPYAVVNPKAFEGGAENAFSNCAKCTMGTGPYMYEGTENGTATFVKNPYYWGAEPEVDMFQVKEIPDNESKILAFQSKELDMLIGSDKVTYDGFTELKDAGCGTSVDTKGSRSAYLGMRVADINIWNETYTEIASTVPAGVFADKNVRQAVSMLIDQQLIAEKVFNGIDTPAETLFGADKAYCDVEQTVYETDPDKAAQLLAESGWEDTDNDGILDKDGEKLSVTISFTNDFGTLSSAMTAIKGELEDAGFEVILAPASDMMGWFMAAMTGSYDLIYWQSNGGAMDPSSTVSNICSMADPVLGLLGGFGSISPELIMELDTTPDDERVQEIYEEILKTISDEALLVPLAYMNDTCVWNPEKVEGYEYYYDAKYTLVQNIRLK